MLAAASVTKLVEKQKAKSLSKKRGFSFSKAAVEAARVEMDAFADAGEWRGARGQHLVALYAWMHEQVYGVPPLELVGRAYAGASMMAQKMIADWFEGDPNLAVDFLKWCWGRERYRVKRRAETGQTSDFRIGWRLQFGRSFLSDYRVAMAQMAKGSR